jgi:lipoyl-dependent peroxiredoxin
MNLLKSSALDPKEQARKGTEGTPEEDRGHLEQATFSLRIPIKDGSETAPAALLASALAKSFSLALTKELGLKAGVQGMIDTTATITLGELEDGWEMTHVDLRVVATWPRITQARFIDAAILAKTNGLVARALRGNISMTAKLQGKRLPIAIK